MLYKGIHLFWIGQSAVSGSIALWLWWCAGCSLSRQDLALKTDLKMGSFTVVWVLDLTPV